MILADVCYRISRQIPSCQYYNETLAIKDEEWNSFSEGEKLAVLKELETKIVELKNQIRKVHGDDIVEMVVNKYY